MTSSPYSPQLLVAIPALNEESTVGEVVREVQQVVPEALIAVIDDGSRDRTALMAEQAGATVLSMPFTVGVGGAMRVAFQYALRGHFDVVVQVDADGQHDPAEIPALLSALGRASVVVGARSPDCDGYPSKRARRLAMRLLAAVLTRMTKTRLTDTTSGFRACDTRAIELFARHYPVEYLGDTVNSLLLASRANLPVREVPVSMRTRQGGQPSQSQLMSVLYLARSLLALGVAIWRPGDERS